MKKITALIGSCIFFFIMMSLYLVLDQFSSSLDRESFARETAKAAKSVAQIRKDVEKLKQNLEFSNQAIITMNEKVDDLKPSDRSPSNDKVTVGDRADKHIEFAQEKSLNLVSGEKGSMCLFTQPKSGHNQDINMVDFFEKIPFDNKDGGVWKQGWDITYKKEDFENKKLRVYVMPHSHNDPGWIKTVQKYFDDQTQKILTNIVNALAKDERRKFIWAETSYFAMWWDRATVAQKTMAQEQIKNGQLEIVTGGWVMNDEANPHYFNMLDQMVEGHQWLKNHIGVQPKYGWAIDPFGYSPTMAYLLKRMGFNGMLIQRVHYNVKKYLAMEKNLEFMWRQNWDDANTTDMFTHSMPFYSYDVPHTCGPDPKICCQFDFKRLPGGGVSCPWHVPPQSISPHNVKQRSEMLLDQYRKKAQLYRSNVVLAPIGDDFRYDKDFEIRAQFENYQKIMDYVNAHPELNAEIRFGTLKDYFTAVARREGVDPGEQPRGFPSLGGDFFTYADRADHYWSGYYTSRSFTKHLDRELAAYLRAAEVIFTIANGHGKRHSEFNGDDYYSKLLFARKELALFQHHDGVTGTAKDHVVIDYGNRMFNAIKDCIHIMEQSTKYLLMQNKIRFKEIDNTPAVTFAETRDRFDQIPIQSTFIISDQPNYVIFYNSLAQERIQVVYVHISDPLVEVVDVNNDIIPHQVSLLWKSSREIKSSKYELSFTVSLPPAGLVKYKIRRGKSEAAKSLASTEVYNFVVPEDSKQFKVTPGVDKQISLKNQYLHAVFDGNDGLLTDMSVNNGSLRKLQIGFMQYGTVASLDRSGAYLFLPSGHAKTIRNNNSPITVTRGKIYSEVAVVMQYVTHRVKVFHVDVPEARSLDIKNVLDISHTTNFELAMRVESDIKNKDKEFFTDLNGFQMQRRKTLAKLPLQANFYPVPTMIFIQDEKSRLSLQTQQSNGGASLEQGYLEVVLDRRLNQDDNRGLGQGVTDNKVTPSNFRLLLEDFQVENIQLKKPQPIAYHSALSITLSHQLLHPLFTFSHTPQNANSYFSYFFGLSKPLPCDMHIVNFKMLQDNIKAKASNAAALFIHRIGYDCRFKWRCSEKKVKFQEIFRPLEIEDIKETSLSLLVDKKKLNKDSSIIVKPMEIGSFKLLLN